MKHEECQNFLALDSNLGFCKRDKSKISADEAACEKFQKARKCKHCINFSYTDDELGTCKGKFDAYPEMNSAGCKDFEPII